MLQRFDAVEHQQSAPSGNETGEPRALVPRRRVARGHLRVAEEPERLGDKEVSGGCALLASSLAVERPVEHALEARPAVASLARHPLGGERSLPDAAPRDDGHDVSLGVFPRGVQTCDLVFAAEEVIGCLSQSRWRNLTRGRAVAG